MTAYMWMTTLFYLAYLCMYLVWGVKHVGSQCIFAHHLSVSWLNCGAAQHLISSIAVNTTGSYTLIMLHVISSKWIEIGTSKKNSEW